jgi:hypothetical protein
MKQLEKHDQISLTEKVNMLRHHLEVGCVVTTNGGEKHIIDRVEDSEAFAVNCFYHWNTEWPYGCEWSRPKMNQKTDTIVSVSWPSHSTSSISIFPKGAHLYVGGHIMPLSGPNANCWRKEDVGNCYISQYNKDDYDLLTVSYGDGLLGEVSLTCSPISLI